MNNKLSRGAEDCIKGTCGSDVCVRCGKKVKQKNSNKSKEFYEWVDSTFDWVDNKAKRLMFRAWCARGKVN